VSSDGTQYITVSCQVLVNKQAYRTIVHSTLNVYVAAKNCTKKIIC